MGVALGLIVALLAVALPAAAAKPSRSERLRIAKEAYERAQRLRASLEGTPEDKRAEKDYLKIINLYLRTYDQAPFANVAADALAATGEMYLEMGQRFGDLYLNKSIETYSQLRKEYPSSRHSDDALFNIAQIYNLHLKDKAKAKESYESFLQSYPRSRHAAKAKEALRAIKLEESKPAPSKVAAAPSGRIQVRNLRYWNAENYTRVVVDLDREVKFQQARISDPDRIFIDLFDTELSTILQGKSFDIDNGLLNRIRVAENRGGVTRVVLEVKDAEDYSVFSLPEPFRLVVDIRGPSTTLARKTPSEEKPREGASASGRALKSASTTPAAPDASRTPMPGPPSVPKPTAAGNHTLSRALGLKVGRIVIDPGHGGHDTGTIGPTGFMEKDLVLDVSRRLGRLLEEQLGAEVIYTREDDTFVPLENRIALANEKQADLFVSIHANYSRDRRVRGVETYYLNFSSDPEVLEVAARENALSQKGVHELQDLVKQISTNEKIAESKELARELVNNLYTELRKNGNGDVRNRGVKQAPFVVLIGGTMPSVLTEISFLSNPEDEKMMKSPSGRQAAAEALFSGVSKYLENINSVANARPSEKNGP
ncbi:MAG TPA: N-acetylmuramoyl-L-alanine amidase [Candidatus Xenobia bacterium]|nr:N-acetylmuramoyl-L-alanine amidase [Candidatus Xenobia bacterium]